MRNFGVNIKDKETNNKKIQLEGKSIDELIAERVGIGKLISSL